MTTLTEHVRDIVDYHLKFAAEGTDLLVLARALDRLTAQPAACTGCGLTLTIEQIKAGGYLSCCPERNMQPVIKVEESAGWRNVVLDVAGMLGFREPLEHAGYTEAELSSGGLAENFQMAVDELKARAIAAEANARTPGTVEVCRMLECEVKHEYQWGDCEAANCPIRAKATQEPKT